MLKKIVGVLFLLVALLFTVFAIQRVFSAPSLGYALGALLPPALFVVIGLFFLQNSPAAAESTNDRASSS